MTLRETLTQKLESQINAWHKQLDSLKSEAEKEKADADVTEQYAQLGSLKQSIAQAREERSDLLLATREQEAVLRELKVHGISSDRVTIKAYGEAYPVASNDTEAGRQQNRRVEVVLSGDDEKNPTVSQTGP